MENLTDKNGNILEVDDTVALYGRPTLFDDGTLGTVCFGFYPDDEEYTTHQHYGWYIKIIGGNTHSLGDIYELCVKFK